MKKLAVLVSFVAGAAIGAVAVHFIENDIFEKKKDEFYEAEVKPARDEYRNKSKELDDLKKELTDKNRILKEKMLDTYQDLNENLGYITDQAVEKATEIKESIEEKVDSSVLAAKNLINDFRGTVVNTVANSNSAYFISGDDYEDHEDYAKISLVYHANGIVIDKDFNPVINPEDILGEENYKQLSKLLEDRVDIAWIRNDDISSDFEIQLADYDFND